MSGRWRIDPESIGKHDHVVLETADHRFALCDPRRFGFVDLVPTAELDAWPPFAAMGPGAARPGSTAAHLKRALAGRRQAVKLLLLDQRIVAGLGNIYVCEALYRRADRPAKGRRQGFASGARAARRRHPRGARRGDRGRRLVACATMPGPMANSAISPSASTFTVARARRAGAGDGGKVRRVAQGGRSTWYCPRCQR